MPLVGVFLACGAPNVDPVQQCLTTSQRRPEPPFIGCLSSPCLENEPKAADRQILGLSEEDKREWRRLVVAAERYIARLRPEEAAAAIGLLRLAQGEHQEAVRHLEAAIAYQGQDASLRNALAVAYLSRAQSQQRGLDLILALEQTQESLALEPGSEAARFNFATLLSQLHLRQQALAAWGRFEVVTSSTHAPLQEITRLRSPSRSEHWNTREQQLSAATTPSDPSEVKAAIRDLPFEARLAAEERLLAQWAESWANGKPREAEQVLALASAIGQALSELRGEHMVADEVATIRAALASGGRRLAALVEGHRHFGRGFRAYERQDLKGAQPELERAAHLLAEAGSPFSGWARFYLAICIYYQDAARAEQLFHELAKVLPENRYSALLGRVHWLLGTVVGVQGNDPLSLEHYRRAETLLERSSGPWGSAFLHVLFAETYSTLGETEAGWAHRLTALEHVSFSGDRRRVHAMLNEASLALIRERHPRAALVFLDELLENAAQWPDHPIAPAEGHTARAQALLELGDRQQALAAVAEARLHLSRLEESALKSQHASWLDLYEGLAHSAAAPERAIRLLTDAFTRQDLAGYQFDRPRYLAARAQSRLRLEQTELAQLDLAEAIRAYERTRQQVLNQEVRQSFFRVAQPAFDTQLELALSQDGPYPNRSFAWAERARARFVSEHLGFSEAGRSDPDSHWASALRNTQVALPRGTVLAEYAVLPSEIVVWVVRKEKVFRVRLPKRGEIEELVTQMIRELRRGADASAVQALAAPLFEGLIRPLELTAEDNRLIVVPDHFLARLPFAALYDPSAKSHLIERLPVTVLPSAQLVARSRKSSPTSPAAARNVLVVGAPELTGVEGLVLRPLPAADREAKEVAGNYPGSSVLLGRVATKERFLAALPNAEIVHFAGHALANEERPGRSKLFLASDGSSSDGQLLASEIWSQDLSHVRLVVLSACESMAGAQEGREALFGLAGGFLAAGVEEVVATLWPVSDEEVVELMARFHEHYREQGNAADALRSAVLEVQREGGRGAYSPAKWAAFEVLGSGDFN